MKEERERGARESMTRIQIKNGRDREDKKLFVPYVFFLSIFMSLPLADRKRERERGRELDARKSHMIIK
jgi:hypothetical protein